MAAPLRKVTRITYYEGYTGCNHGACSADATLECGHVKHYSKGSRVPNRARCETCERQRTKGS